MVGVIFAGMFGFPNNAYATCINTLQSQTIAAAYNGDETPTVHEMNTCSGDDVSYQIPIATSITFDGIEYSDIYATTNSVITFGRPDGTYWAYPSTPSISLYSMDWYPGASNTDGLDIFYSEGGFQINLNMVPYGNYGAEPSTVNILVAITNTGGISVAYSYQGPEYAGMRTGVRLHNGDIVSLEEWGATQIQPGEALPTLQPEPVAPSQEPLTPEQQQTITAQAVQLASEISDLNNLIASINGETTEEVTPIPEPTEEPTLDPDIVVEPEVITPEDPRFPDDQEQTEPDSPNPSPSSETTDEAKPDHDVDPEPTQEPSPQPTDTDSSQETQPDSTDDEQPLIPAPDNSNTNTSISEEELKKINSLVTANLISQKDVNLLIELAKKDEVILQAIQEFTERAEENENAPMPYTIADAITEVHVEKLLENPIEVLTDIDLEVLLSPSEWGKDMTDDQREKVQEIVVSVIIASNLISASMTRRIG